MQFAGRAEAPGSVPVQEPAPPLPDPPHQGQAGQLPPVRRGLPDRDQPAGQHSPLEVQISVDQHRQPHTGAPLPLWVLSVLNLYN